jgi:hypothetical protein
MNIACYSAFAGTFAAFKNGDSMDTKLNFLTPTPVSPTAGRALPIARKADAKPSANDFSQILSGQMFKAQRQGLATSHSAGTDLQVVPLGKTMNVITSNAAVPDATSLANFARSQGFDEAAVQALFGPKSST